MTVGEALAEARYRAGLTVDELSERTRIREAVIRCIEQDDYEACGGDLYVRGYVRAIAGAVGIDAQPLIREYDAARAAAPAGAADPRPAEPAAIASHPVLSPGGALVPESSLLPDATVLPDALFPDPVASDPAVTRFDLPVTPAAPDATMADPWLTTDPGFTTDAGFTIDDPGSTTADPWGTPPAPGSTTADSWGASADTGFTTAEWQYTAADPWGTPADPAPASAVPFGAAGQNLGAPRPVRAPSASAHGQSREQSAWRARIRGRRWVTGIVILVAIVLALAGLAGSHIISSLRHSSAANAANSATPSTGGKHQPSSPATPAPKVSTPPPTPAPSTQPAPAARQLSVPLAAAFGPAGTADGDNPQIASFAITRGSPSPWQTDWYTTADFGLLKHGTGLLLDMGKTVTITSVRFDLSGFHGGKLQLRAGGRASLEGLRVVKSASDAAGTVRFVFASPVRARYLLIWFTLLPPNGTGKYQESVGNVVVRGRP